MTLINFTQGHSPSADLTTIQAVYSQDTTQCLVCTLQSSQRIANVRTDGSRLMRIWKILPSSFQVLWKAHVDLSLSLILLEIHFVGKKYAWVFRKS